MNRNQFTPNAAQRIAKATRTVERSLKNDGAGRGRWQGDTTRLQLFILDEDLAQGGAALGRRYAWSASAASGIAAGSGGAGGEHSTHGTYGIDDTGSQVIRDTAELGPFASGVRVWCQPRGTDAGTIYEVTGAAAAGNTIYGIRLTGSHPGYKIPFDVYLGIWSAADDDFAYAMDEPVKAIDLRWGVPYPDGGEGSGSGSGSYVDGIGWPMPSSEYGTIYVVLDLDCEA